MPAGIPAQPDKFWLSGVWSFLWLRAYPWTFLAAVSITGLHLLLTLLLVPLAQNLEILFQAPALSQVLTVLAMILGVYALKGLCLWGQTLLWGKLAFWRTHQRREALYRKLLEQPLSRWQAWQEGDLVARLTVDLQLLETAHWGQLTQFFPNLLLLSGLLLCLLALNPLLLLVSLLLLPLGSRLLLLTGRPLTHWSRRHLQLRGELTQEISETLQNLPSLWPLRVSPWLLERLKACQTEMRSAQLRQLAWQASQGPLLALVQVLAIGGVVLLGVWQVRSQAVAGGELLAFAAALALSVDPLLALVQAWGSVQAAQAAEERLRELEAWEAVSIPQAVKRSRPSVLQVKELSYAYPAQPPLFQGLSLMLSPGRWSALLGPSGCGKSTLLALLAGQMAVQEGQIEPAPEEAGVLILPQKSGFFNRSLRENICLGRSVAAAELQLVLQICQLQDLVASLPEGLETLMGNQGGHFSGGERQRVALARVLLAHPKILLLDEATSELDWVTEQRIFQALRQYQPELGCLQVTHRLVSLTGIQQFLLLEHGTIRESGSLEQLAVYSPWLQGLLLKKHDP